jgi:hypothetical protein
VLIRIVLTYAFSFLCLCFATLSSQHFHVKNVGPFTNQLTTRLTEAKNIPYYVTDKFLNTYNRNPYQLGQIEVMVERAFEHFLVVECKSQIDYKGKLEENANNIPDEVERNRKLQAARSFQLGRCQQLHHYFPKRKL